MASDVGGPSPGGRPATVVVVGSVNRDYVCRVPAIPRPGETLLGADLSLGSGGKGGNQAVAAASAGATTTLIARVGDDADGRALRADLAASGVDISGVRTSADAASGVAFVMVADDGENAIVVAPGSNGELDGDAVTAALAGRLTSGDVLLLQGEIPVAGIEAAAAVAERRGARVVLNLAPYREVSAALLSLCDPLVVNAGEARALMSDASVAEQGDERRAEELALALAARARSVVITLGSAGAVMVADGRYDAVPAPEIDVVDSTGAGDAFTGALAASLARGDDLATAVGHGVAAGSIAVTHAGARPPISTRRDPSPSDGS